MSSANIENSASKENNQYIGLPPDIVEATLPYLSTDDIRNLSLTNKYYNKLLDFDDSMTLWHALFHKSYGTLMTNEEPFRNSQNSNYMTHIETVMCNRYPDKSWQELFSIRTNNVKLYTWGCLKHARLGYTVATNSLVDEETLNGTASRFKYGVNKPTPVPWYPPDSNIKDRNIVQISGGGFSFQILTSSGKIFSTGPTYTGGHKGPGPKEGTLDYNPFRDAIRRMEGSYPRILVGPTRTSVSTTGTFNAGSIPTVPTSAPHRNIYKEIEDLEEHATEQIPGNTHISRMFTRNSFPIYHGVDNDFHINYAKYGKLRFIAISSGRSHFIGLTSENDIYSWDNCESNHGIHIGFDGLPDRERCPILKIACGWDFSCVYIYEVGLVVWKEREPVQKGDLYSNAKYLVIDGTDNNNGDDRLVDFTCVQDTIVYYIKNEGDKLWKFDKGRISTIELSDTIVEGKLMKIISCLSSLVMFTENDCYSIDMSNGHLKMETLKKLKLDDPDDRIISLSAGDYHTIALTQRGKLYTWGVESQFSGCFGLGRPEKLVDQLHVARWDGARNIRINKPTRIRFADDEVCIAIAAGGWQSAALTVHN